MFQGSITALVTPWDKDGKLYEEELKRLLEFQVQNGTNGVVLAGCTGESFTLEEDERIRLLEIAKEKCGGKMPIIIGSGSSSLAVAKRFTKSALDNGADAVLVITPYGNKPSQEGMYKYFMEIADIGLPLILYNVPSRTGSNLLPETVIKLSSHPNIVAIKEASGSLDAVSAIIAGCDITVLSGDDSLTLPIMAIGAKGVVSTVSNIAPADMSKLCGFALAGDFESAKRVHLKLFPVMKALFVEGNPTPLKAALKLMGLSEGYLRPPLAPVSEKNLEIIKKALTEAGLI